jgi:hypothetical protein
MSQEQATNGPASWGQVEELRAEVAAMRAEVAALRARADESNHRADAGDDLAAAQDVRVSTLEDRADADHDLIAELQADGLLNRQNTANLTQALHTARRIGAAVGIVMAGRVVEEDVAFAMLSKASQHTNRKLRDIAEDVVRTGDVSQLPEV